MAKERREQPAFIAEKKRVMASLVVFENTANKEVVDFISAAYNNPEWDWTLSDGCTVVSEAWWPGPRFPTCVGHDHWWECEVPKGKSRRERDIISRRGDYLLREANKAYGMAFPRRWLRWIGVRANWIFRKRWTYPK